MKKLKKILCITILFMIVVICVESNVFAEELSDYLLDNIEESDEYKNWKELSDEEKEKVIQPVPFTIPRTKLEFKNPINLIDLLSAQFESKFDLRDIISNNLVIKNQGQTDTCWTFASIAALETNLAMRDYKSNSGISKVYDYSERHMDYATSRTFANNQINDKGFGREAGMGGNEYLASAYLTNGSGAVLEKDMPFQNNSDKINLSEIDKTVQTQVYDTVNFPLSSGFEDSEELRNEMKSHIKNYGGIIARIHGADLNSEYYNEKTGAIYCDDLNKCPSNHAVLIIGWDDNYDTQNFAETHRPSQKGAWIIKNSWGTKIEYNLSEMKEAIFASFESECRNNGWDEPTKISDDFAKQFSQSLGFEINGNTIYKLVGDDGFMYISYQDVVVYSALYGITKANDQLDYENLYQYDIFGVTNFLPFATSEIYLASIFDKKTNGKESVNQISIYAPETYTCEVYINPEGEEKSPESLKQVELKTGKTETFGAGYHTLEFLEPIEITGDKFTIVVKAKGTRNNSIIACVEDKREGTFFQNVTVENNKCFWTLPGAFEKDNWLDFGTLNSVNNAYPNSDLTIKAFTISESVDVEPSLESIEITTPPNKTSYIVGDNFDTNGMVVTAKYENDQTKKITNYTIENGENLSLGQTYVTISYKGKTVNQKIEVKEKQINNPENKEPENSVFDSMKSHVKNVKTYVYTDKSKETYMIIDVQLTNIIRSEKNDSMEYYYYLSSSSNIRNITKWIKINETQNQTDKLVFSINTKDVDNLEELTKSENLYLYIKEIAKRGANSKELVTSPVLLAYSGSGDLYLDDVKVDSNGSNNNNNNNNNGNNNNENNNNNNGENSNNSGNNKNNQDGSSGNSKKDDTTANKSLPNAGKSFLITIIFIVSIVGIFMYIKYEKIDK